VFRTIVEDELVTTSSCTKKFTGFCSWLIVGFLMLTAVQTQLLAFWMTSVKASNLLTSNYSLTLV